MNIAIAQMNTKVGDFETTTERMLQQAQLAQERNADLLVFPLATLTGAAPGGLTESEEFMTDLISAILSFTQKAPLPCIVPITIDFVDGVFNEAILINNQKATPLVLASRASELYQQPGAGQDHGGPVVFTLNNLRFSVAFGEADLEGAASGFSEQPSDVLLYLPSGSFNADDDMTTMAPSVSEGAYVQIASGANAWLVAANSVGGYDAAVYAGGSFVMAPWGELAGVAPSFEEGLLVCEIDVNAEGPLAHPVAPPSYNRPKLLWDALVLCLRDFVEKSGLEGVVVPMTGQLTSSVVAVLAVDALGPQHVHAMMLPVHERLGSADFCRQLALHLHIGYEDPLSSEVGDRSRILSKTMEAWGDARVVVRRLHTELANVMASHRARERRAGVVGIFDKTAIAVEIAQSASTVSVVEPLGDVYRTEVAELARWRNLSSAVIPVDMIESYDIPDDLGIEGTSAEYNLSVLDAILFLHIERGFGLSSIVGEGFNETVVERVLRRLDECALWRSRIPTVPAISQCPFADRAWPVCMSWHDRARSESEMAKTEELLRASLESTLNVDAGMDAFWEDLRG